MRKAIAYQRKRFHALFSNLPISYLRPTSCLLHRLSIFPFSPSPVFSLSFQLVLSQGLQAGRQIFPELTPISCHAREISEREHGRWDEKVGQAAFYKTQKSLHVSENVCDTGVCGKKFLTPNTSSHKLLFQN